MLVGARVREWRRRRGMPIIELARRASISRGIVYRIEAGRPTELLPRIARVLEVRVDDLVDGASEAVA
jgi:transcriptional regulator with XRE-family HTH domain